MIQRLLVLTSVWQTVRQTDRHAANSKVAHTHSRCAIKTYGAFIYDKYNGTERLTWLLRSWPRVWSISLLSRSSCVRTFSSGFHAAGDVDRITKETVPRHRDSNYSADHWSTVHAAADHQFTIWTMRNLPASTSIDKKLMFYTLCLKKSMPLDVW